ncbi:MAG TPA: hypothetical protein VG712_02140 [Gemmatimonadales bacterium]|nr:hypothetical protein [Gemmatimonadales bacterium]
MTDTLRIYRLWRTSAVLCTLGGAEFGYVAWLRHTWWPLLVTAALFAVAGLAFRKAGAARRDLAR